MHTACFQVFVRVTVFVLAFVFVFVYVYTYVYTYVYVYVLDRETSASYCRVRCSKRDGFALNFSRRCVLICIVV